MSISHDIREWCDESYVDSNACDELRELADRIDREMEEKERLKKENAELTAELDDWKGNAEGFQPYAYMRLPLDADGVPIRIGDTVYTRDAEEYTVRGIYALADEYSISVVQLGGTCFLPMEPEGLTHRTTDSADSWERIAGDIKAAEGWCDHNGDYGTGIVSISEQKLREWSDRIRKLAGIEEEAQR